LVWKAGLDLVCFIFATIGWDGDSLIRKGGGWFILALGGIKIDEGKAVFEWDRGAASLELA